LPQGWWAGSLKNKENKKRGSPSSNGRQRKNKERSPNSKRKQRKSRDTSDAILGRAENIIFNLGDQMDIKTQQEAFAL